MKPTVLFASPFTCSLAVHVQLTRMNRPIDLKWMTRGPGRRIADAELAALNPKRKVPTLNTPEGEVLTEIVAVLDHLHGLPNRRAHLTWLAMIATELHQQILGPVFDPDTPEVTKSDIQNRLLSDCIGLFSERLAESDTLLGGPATGADAYLHWGLLLLRNLWPDAVSAPPLKAFHKRMVALPEVQHVLGVERARYAVS